jgi:hypothetical protein
MITKRITSCGLIAILIVACSSDHSTEGPEGGSGGSSSKDAGSGGKKMDGGGTGGHTGTGGSTASGGASSDAGATAPMNGVVVDNSTFQTEKSFDPSKYPALSGVKVCVYDDSSVPCATTDSNGKYTINLPIGHASYVSYEKDGYTPTLYANTPTSNAAISSPPLFLPPTTFTDTFLKQAGLTNDSKQGGILFGGVELGPSSAPTHELFGTTEVFYLSGLSATVSPAASTDPIFVGDDWKPDPSLKQSSTAGWGFIQAKPGDYTLTISKPGYSCPSTTTKVVAGYETTYVGALCTKTSDGGVADAATH